MPTYALDTQAESNLVAVAQLHSKEANVGLQAYESLEWVGANALWQVQAPNGLNTEPVTMGCGYCLQHLPSGKYLTVASADEAAAAPTATQVATAGAGGFPVNLVAGPLEQAALFELHNHQMEGSAKHLPASSIVRLRHVGSGGWVHAEPATGNVVVVERCYIRDGFLAERPLRVCRTFYAVSGVTGLLLRHADALVTGEKTGNEPDPKSLGPLRYLTRFLTTGAEDALVEGGTSGPSDDAVSSNLQDLMRELGLLDALITMLVAPFKRLGTTAGRRRIAPSSCRRRVPSARPVPPKAPAAPKRRLHFPPPGTVAFHKLDDNKPLIRISRMVAELLWVSIRGNRTSCQYVYRHITSFELAARKSIGIGRVLEEVFSAVEVDAAQVDFWVDLLSKARCLPPHHPHPPPPPACWHSPPAPLR